jgi:hypothetical protein
MSDVTGLTQGFDEARTVSHASAPGEARILTDALITWLSEERSRPFFLYAHYMGPHSPYDVPSRFSGRFTADLQPSKIIEEFHKLYELESEVEAYRLVTQIAREGGLSAGDVEYLKAEYNDRLHVRSGFRIHELYDLRTDPLEQNNVAHVAAAEAARQREIAYRLWGEISDHSRRQNLVYEAMELDPETIDALQSLGYLDDGS